jgi:hypothetical protein
MEQGAGSRWLTRREKQLHTLHGIASAMHLAGALHLLMIMLLRYSAVCIQYRDKAKGEKRG